MFEAMMLRFQEDTSRHLFRMQIIGPDGTPVETAEQLARIQSATLPATPLPGTPTPPPAAESPRQPAPASNRAPSTTIDALEREFHKKKQRELDLARAASSASADTNGNAPRAAGAKVGRNDECPCGSGKKYKKCHGANA
jgi:preprotein translocase subunit SecA